jgi:hypothetical protein
MSQPKKQIPPGAIFGRLTVLRETETRTDKKVHWLCRCECGNEKEASGRDLRGGKVRSCGCYRREVASESLRNGRRIIEPERIENGTKFNRLTVISFDHWDATIHRSFYVCACECGARCIKNNVSLKSGHSKSCGCLWRENIAASNTAKKKTHGMSRSPEYRAWRSMKMRCERPSCRFYRHYGGRGIAICERWRVSFENFIFDIGMRPKGHSLDRIDVNGNYEPGNCRWATNIEQANNKRPRHRIEQFSDEALLAEIKRRGLG